MGSFHFKSATLLLAIVSFFYCRTATATEHVVATPLSSHLENTYADDLGGILQRRHIRVLTTFNKTNFFIVGGKRYGFEYSLLKDYETFLNKGSSWRDLRTVMEFIPVARDKLVQALIDGYGDIAAAGLTITPDRSKKVDFTDPYLSGVDEIVVAHKNITGLNAIDDLSGKSVFVRKSSSYYESLNGLNRTLKKNRKRPVKIVTADENLETEDILELVHSGAIGITISDSHIAEIWSNVFKDIRLHKELKVRSGSRIAWMVRKKNPELKAHLNTFIKSHKKGTLHGNIYFNRYYKKTKWIKNPVRPVEREKLERYRALFQKYSEKYGFDWMLISALAYQESGLNNSKRSRSGAVGIMQVLPRTAADKNVGIADVRTAENNIHAGVKYLAFLRDRYFSGDHISDDDKVRLTLASYNAGPAKIRRARTEAKSMGLDPDIWFRNVEMAVLKQVGQETVQYVSNINKYYVLFRSAYTKREIRQKAKEQLLD